MNDIDIITLMPNCPNIWGLGCICVWLRLSHIYLCVKLCNGEGIFYYNILRFQYDILWCLWCVHFVWQVVMVTVLMTHNWLSYAIHFHGYVYNCIICLGRCFPNNSICMLELFYSILICVMMLLDYCTCFIFFMKFCLLWDTVMAWHWEGLLF